MTPLTAGTVIVYERDGAWSRALRRFVPPEISVIEMSPFDRVEIRPDIPRAVLAVLAEPKDVQPLLTWARQILHEDYHALRMAVVRPAEQELAWCLRETGIRMIWDEFWQVPAMARFVCRFYHRHVPADLSVEQQIWNNLPWNSN